MGRRLPRRGAGHGVSGARAQKLDLDSSTLVDLTHPYNAKTIYWPTEKAAFKLEPRSVGQTPGGYFYAAFAFCMPEHGGTHLDAPYHFGEHQEPAEQIPLRRLIAPAVVIDVTDAARKDRDYRVTAADVLAFEKAKAARLPPARSCWCAPAGAATGPIALAYLGDDTPGDASKLRFPGYGEDAARLLVEERQVARPRHRHRVGRLRPIDRLHRPSRGRGAQRAEPREPCQPRSAAAARRDGDGPADEDRRRLRRAGPGRRHRAAPVGAVREPPA